MSERRNILNMVPNWYRPLERKEITRMMFTPARILGEEIR
jgi:hypothetical protein